MANGLKTQILNVLANGNTMTADKLVSEIAKNSTATTQSNGNGKIRHKQPINKETGIGRVNNACRHLAKQGKITMTRKAKAKDTNVFTCSYQKV